MKYIDQQQSISLSCDCCIFSRQTYEKKSVKDPSSPKRKKVVDKPTGLYGFTLQKVSHTIAAWREK